MEHKYEKPTICDKEVRDHGLSVKGGDIIVEEGDRREIALRVAFMYDRDRKLSVGELLLSAERVLGFLTRTVEGGNDGTDTSQDG